MKGLLYYVTILLLISLNLSKLSQSFHSGVDVVYASIYKNDSNEWIIENSFISDRIAAAKYTVGLEKIGWDLLAVKTNKNFPDDLQAEAAGRLEGYLTRERIWNHWRNLNLKTWKGKNMEESSREFLRQQELV